MSINRPGCPSSYSNQLTITFGGPPVAFARIYLAGGLGDLTVSDGSEIISNPGGSTGYIETHGISNLTITATTPEWEFGIYDVDWSYCFPDSTPTPTPTPIPTPTPDHARNLGESCPNQMVGKPVNVTNGNVYLKQTDYKLPGMGEAISFGRSYNSKGTRFGLFGPGWSTDYDEGLLINNENMTLRLYMPDGKATDFLGDGNGAFAPVQPDFYGQISQNTDGTFRLSFKDGRVHAFTSFGALLSLTDRNNNQTTLAYDQSGRLASVTDPSGRVASVTTNSFGMVLSIGDSLGTAAMYAYDSNLRLVSVTYPDNSGYRFSYDAKGLMTSVTDISGTELEAHAYDAQGRAIISTRADGIERYSLNYVSDSETDVTDALGHITRYFFDTASSRNLVTRVEGLCSCGSGSQSQTWTYDNNLNVTSYTNGLNQVTTYTYDAQGNQLTATDAAGTTTSTYNQFGEILSLTDALGGTTSITYDDQGLPVSITDPLNHVTSYASDSNGQLVLVIDARGKMTRFAYDSRGNLITTTDALGHATQCTYDARGRLTTRTNALGHVTTFAYDAVGMVTQVAQADGSVIGYQYDAAGRLITVTDAKGNRTSYTYDRGYRLSSETDALFQTTFYQYDLMSNLVARTDVLGRTTNFDYDDFNRPAKITYPEATTGATRLFATVTYDAVGNATQRTDTEGRVTSYLYDDVNRVVSTTDADNKTTTFEYDALSRMTALVDALSQRYRFNYDNLGRLRHIRRGTTVMSFTYDAVGNRKKRTDYNGALTDYTYDALNRLKTIGYPDTTTVSYTYDKLSRLQTATNETGTIDFDYNRMNRLTNVTDGFGQVVDYNYDPNGNRTRLSVNFSTIATYRYDAVNRLTRILDAAGAAFTFDYDATNRLTQKKAPNGLKTSYQYDGLDRLTRLTDTKGVATLEDRQYQYNPASQISQVTEPLNTKSYGYDAVDRLIGAFYTNPLQRNESYAYDGVGNRASSYLSTSYSYQPFNRLTSTSTATYTEDSNGNLISKTDSSGTTQYSWDFENRLKQVTLPNGSTVSYKYDALGRRIQRSPSSGVSTNFVYDGQEVIKDLNSDGSIVDYLNGPGIDNKLRLTDSRLSATGPLYFVQDHLGSTTALANSLGVAVSQISYDSFGNASADASLTRYTYTGREFDSDTGLYYYRARWYDPKVGRFISEDPIGFAGGINQFAYVGNNPRNSKDPTGLHNEDVHYYLTYFIATKFSCLTSHEARLIADADQSTDENPDTAPWLGITVAQAMSNGDNHAFTEWATSRLSDLRAAALSTTHNYVGTGRYLHFLQDTFSHRGYDNMIIGQFGFNGVDLPFFGGFVVDNTNHDLIKSEDMARATFFAIYEWAKNKDCKCKFTDIGSWWPQVLEFLRTDNGDVEKKRQILSVPKR